MVTVKLFGLFRLDTGLKEIKAEASSVKELYPILLDEAKKVNPTTMITAADIDGCIVVINGKQSKKNSKLRDGDIVFLMSPVCGG
ncbi:MAG: MoaD/ThiS family protein [Lachnospiraceae bacterium]|nr:MoaD/ThiS family protein [Lachnospiraceae bacterium]MBR3360100.1 MoaD/ThiS family protein [Lachnospiraceae bacterium]MDO4206783.1 MoaD/ThiS family protein [Lachnospiraceae bacterium]